MTTASAYQGAASRCLCEWVTRGGRTGPALLASLGQTSLSLSWGFLLSQFLALDTQMLMGNRRYSLSPEEYIFGALNIYLDIIYIFSFFLQFFGSSQE